MPNAINCIVSQFLHRTYEINKESMISTSLQPLNVKGFANDAFEDPIRVELGSDCFEPF